MNLLNPRYWFQKRTGAFAAASAEQMNRMRYNALFALDPDVLVRHLVAFNAGDIAGLEHVLEEFENREDKMKIGAFKMSAAVASKPWEVRIAKGEEDNERAKLHREVLTRFWNRVETTDAFCRNRRGGVRMLVRQMMSAQSRVFAVHDVTWKVRGDGELEALFTFVPAWMFENRTGELRFLKDPGAYTGIPMNDGEWLVTVGEGVGISAALLAMAKRLSWNDWLLFSEKCGMPVILGNTGAKEDTPAWKQLLHAIANVAPKTGILANLETKLQAVQIGGSSGQTTYRELIEVVDRGISSLYRGGDLATMSQGTDGVGSNSQDGESELMDADGCAMISETLQRQIERHVVRFTCGDFEPLAGIVINPPAETEDIDREIKIDTHLATLGVKLSKADALSRYGRTEATDDDDALQPASNAPQNGLQPGFNGLPNEEQNKTPFNRAETPFKISRSDSDGQGDGSGLQELLGAFSRDLGPAAEEVKKLLADLDAGKDVTDAAKALAEKLPELMPEDPAMAAVLAEAMAKEFGASRPDASAQSDALANEEEQPRGKTTPDSTPGSFAPAGSGAEISKVKDAQPDDVSKKSPAKASDEEIKAFLESPIEDIDVELANRLLEKGFEVEDGAGNKLHFGTRMKKHLEDHGQEESDRRKRRLRAGVELVKTTEPVISVRDANVSCYFGSVAGKNYLVMTDNSGEVYEVWDMFRRDKWKNEQKKGASSGQPADATGPHTPARKRPIAPTSSNRPNDGSSHDIKGGQT